MHIKAQLYKECLEDSLRYALVFLDNQNHSNVGATVDLERLRKRLGKPLLKKSISSTRVVREMVRDVRGGILGSAGARFFGWVIGGSIPAALAADWLVSVWDQNAALYATAPAAAVVEEVAAKWLKNILGIPDTATFAFVTGCQMAHATCMAAARHALLAERGWQAERQGLYGAPPIRILSSGQRHGSVERAARLLGLGDSHFEYLLSNARDRLDPAALDRALRSEPRFPTIVLLQAGDINTGAFDDFESLIPVAKRYDAWVHIDGAFGLWAAASSKYRHLTNGIADADSWVTDGHKWLNVPFDSGYAFIASAEAHRASMSYRAPYLAHSEVARDEIDWNPEWSRRARGFPTYAALRQLGRDGIAALVERCCDHAHTLVAGIGQLPGAQMLWEPVINQGLVRFLDRSAKATEADHDRRTNEVIASITATGEAFFEGTTWRGHRAMRVSVCNWQTTNADVDRVIAIVANTLKG